MSKWLASVLAAGCIVMFSVSAAPAQARVASSQAPALVAPTAVTYKFKNCTALNKVYRHGVGRNGARDHTSGKRVTTFKASTSLYKKIIGYRSGLDRDKDGIACEKA